MIPQNTWKAYPLPDDTPQRFRFGDLLLWVKTAHDEIWLDYRYLPQGQAIDPSYSEPTDEDYSWQRWTIPGKQKELQLGPIFPDLPILVTPEFPFRMVPGVTTTIYVRVPVWVELLIGDSRVTAIPSVVLSKTWFGHFLEGELCYWISSGARKAINPDPERPYMAICPIQIRNTADIELQVEKICLRVEQLDLYSHENQLYGNETRMIYKGVSTTSEVQVSRGAPKAAPKAKQITPARLPQSRSMTARTFSTLKEIPGFGLFNR